MGLQSGTPLWASLLLSVGAVAATHFLTRWRESDKRKKDYLDAWLEDAESLLASISDEAVAYYSDPKVLESTPVASQRILHLLKRFGWKIRDVKFVDANESKELMVLNGELRDIITLPDDFGDQTRVIRGLKDELLERIREVEGQLRANLRKPRRVKKKGEK